MADPIVYTDIDQLKKNNRQKIKDITNQPERIGTVIPSNDLREQQKLNRESVSNARDTNIVSSAADKMGIDLSKPYAYPLTDEFKEKLIKSVEPMVAADDLNKTVNFVRSIPDPNYVAPPTINTDYEKAQARRERKMRWADAFNIMGQSLQGKDINTEKLGTTRLQRERDKRFQDFKTISEANKKTANDWEVNSRNQTMDWIQKELQNDQLAESEKRKYQLLYDQMAEQKIQHNNEMKARGRQIGVQEGELGLRQKEFDEKYGTTEITYQTASGQTITRTISKSEQKDIISRAKMDPEFKKYIQAAMNVRYQTIMNADGELESIPVNELGKEVTDRDLLQAYLRWETIGSPNKSWPEQQNPGQPVNNMPQETENTPPKSFDDFFSK